MPDEPNEGAAVGCVGPDGLGAYGDGAPDDGPLGEDAYGDGVPDDGGPTDGAPDIGCCDGECGRAP